MICAYILTYLDFSGEEKLNPSSLARVGYPDKDGREIVLSSSSENAMGVQREEVMPFTFDKVFPFSLCAAGDF